MVTLTGGGGGGTDYDYVQDDDPTTDNDVESGEQWYDTADEEAKIWNGEEWSLLNTTDHSQLEGVTATNHRSDANIVSTVEGSADHDSLEGVTADNHHARYTDSEASSAAPVDSVNGETGEVTVETTPSVQTEDRLIVDDGYTETNDTDELWYVSVRAFAEQDIDYFRMRLNVDGETVVDQSIDLINATLEDTARINGGAMVGPGSTIEVSNINGCRDFGYNKQRVDF